MNTTMNTLLETLTMSTMTPTTTLALSLSLGAVLLAGCSSTPVAPATPPVTSQAVRTPVATTPATPPAASQARTTTLDLAAQQRAAQQAAAAAAVAAAATAPRVVYFDFDSFAIKEEFKPTLDTHAKVLATSKGRKYIVEGHADARGGREYNLALGQKRAAAVVSSMTLLGAADAQIEAVSFGEERPAVAGSGEAAWSKNRRAELKDR